MLNNKQVLELATQLHLPHKRKNGEAYITHPIAVAGLVLEYITRNIDDWQEPAKDILIQAALLHDVLEDCDNLTAEDLYFAGVDPQVIDICKVLNKKLYPNYRTYICSIKNYFPAIVKYFDLTHNISDLSPGSLKDKYEMSRAYLAMKFNDINLDTV